MERINVTRSSMPTFEEYINEIKPLWDSRWLTNCGALHNELEEQLEKYLNVKNVSLFNNGHLALYTAINSLDLKGEVITTPFTFVSTTNAIVQNNLKPVFCDINEEDYTIDVDKIEQLITDKTSAIVAVHVYGNVCNVDKINKIAKKHNLKVIYDAAHAFGVEYNGKTIGNYGDISMMSFHATKVFHTIEGGALLYNSNIKEKIKSLRNFGIINQEECEYIGMNTKMSEFHAAMGICNLRHIDEEILKRKKIVERYQEKLKDIPGIKCWQKQKNVKANYIYFPIYIDEKRYGISRDLLFEKLKEKGIISRKYFYPLVTDFRCYENYVSNTPIAKKIAKGILTLPLYADLNFSQVDYICDIIKMEGK